MPSWGNIKAFLWGALWAVLNGLGPAALVVWDTLVEYEDPVDWKFVRKLAAYGVSLTTARYCKRNKALLIRQP
jgi:hypothetical protein